MLALKLLGLLALAAVAAIVARAVLGPEVRMYRVPSQSMTPTVAVGAKVMANFGAYDGRGPRFGDIVLVRPPVGDLQAAQCGAQPPAGAMCSTPMGGAGRTQYVKRVVGLPGDRLALEHGRLVRNGRAVDEPYARACGGVNCDFPKPITVLPGDYYVLGDNRGASADSRFWGPVPRKEVLARVDDCAPVIRLFCRAKG
jgi:signal peptidase I